MNLEQVLSNLASFGNSLRNAVISTPIENSDNNSYGNIKFNHQFKSLNFYSIPESVLIVLRRRLLYIYTAVACLFSWFWSMF